MPARDGKLFLGITFVLLAGLANTSRGQVPVLPNSHLGHRTAPILLLTRADVRAELGLTPELAQECNQLCERLHRKVRSLAGRTDAAVLEARKAIDLEQQQWLKTHLNEKQIERLVQIDLQWEGPSSIYSRPIVVETLGLTTEQREALKLVVQDWQAKRRANTSIPIDTKAYWGQVLAILSEPQREVWAEMLGKSFTPQPEAAPATAAAKDSRAKR
ncbi:hypothetical protein [Singulisphaera sp. PoT]|uniref:hypothetical protein n=1 Tax=Singulisphaera sp. PoT TaxID=3411797 RepID=UPI003BF4EDE4